MTQHKPVHFTKMHGLGNDFVIINAIKTPVDTKNLPITQLADRHRGIGFDQMLIIETAKNHHYFCRIYNADGSEAEQCGNGLRCVARYLHEEKIQTDKTLTLETKAGSFPVNIEDYDHIRIAMSQPDIQQALIEVKLPQYPLPVKMSILSLGNPHTIIKVDTIDQPSFDQFASAIATHDIFPHGANVGLMQVLNEHHIRLRTYERGVGETRACGSNACAAVVAGFVNGWLKQKVSVAFRDGNLSIEWAGSDHPIFMTGPASRVFNGEFKIIPTN